MAKKDISKEIEIPKGTNVEINGFEIKVKGSKGEVTRLMRNKSVKITKEGNIIKVKPVLKHTRKEKKMIGTFTAHIKNMIKGTNEGVIYKLKSCSAHFPMNIAVVKDRFEVKNFLGEKIPRTFTIPKAAKVTVSGADVTVEGVDLELVSQVAARIEQLTRITNRDRRIFQDGIYITHKDNKELE